MLEAKSMPLAEELARLIGSLHMEPAPDRQELCEKVRQCLSARSHHFQGEVSDRMLWFYVRHYFTNYDELLAEVKMKVGASELYANVKVYFCCRIIREYGLEVDPLYAAFGKDGTYGAISGRFIVDNLEATVAQLILEELLKGSVRAQRRAHRSDARVIVRRGRELGKARPVDKEHQANEQKQQEVSR